MNSIAKIRKSRKLSQKELAKLLGVTQQRVSKIETTLPEQLSYRQLKALSEALQCSIKDLIEG